MRKFFLSFTFFVMTASTGWAFSPNVLRFHCENDTVKIQNLLAAGLEQRTNDPNKLMSFYADKFIGTPYVAHTLEGDKEYLTINTDEVDCTTFVETLVALTKTTLAHRRSWRDYASNLENIRYRKGEIDGYPSRLHYVCEWVLDNSSRGNLKEVTTNFSNTTYITKTINYMSRHKDLYASLKDNEENLERIKNVETGLHLHRYPILKLAALVDKNIKKMFVDGDIVIFLTKIEGLDASHMGVIKMINSKPYLLHASMTDGKVEVSADELFEVVRRSKNVSGIRVIKVAE